MLFGRRAAAAACAALLLACQNVRPATRAAVEPSAQSALRDGACRVDQVRVRHRALDFCVDLYEAPGFGAVPDSLSHDDASAYCAARERRLCRESEWQAACRGPDGLAYPYGDVFTRGACAVGGGARAVGTSNGCRSPVGTYDMSGNAAEWVAEGLLKGGDHASDAFGARCASRSRPGVPPEPTLTGVRCCSDPAR